MKRIYVIKGKGTLVNATRGVPSYDIATVRLALENLLKDTTIAYDTYVVSVPHLGSGATPDSCVWKYDSNKVEFRVASTTGARRAFRDCLRISHGHVDGHGVLAVFGEEHHRTYKVFATIAEAFAGDEVPIDVQFVELP